MTKYCTIKKILRAFENKDVGYIQSLVLQEEINPNALIPSKGVSLLHLIIGHQSENFAFRVIKLFLRCGGNPNVQSSDGVTPIHVAAAWGRNRILHLLLVNGGDPWMQDDEKKNAFNYAFEEREWNTIEMLHHFQQMHSAANSKQDIYPKYERSLERVVLRKGEEVFAYGPSKRNTKSSTTQTQNDVSSSPVQDKIRYFEPEVTPSLEIDFSKEPEKNAGWVKDFYQTSCEVVVHRDASEIPEEKQETFVSTIHIQPSVVSGCRGDAAEKSDQSSVDVRGQLFMELREAVRRRSKLKMLQEEQNNISITKEPLLIGDDPCKDSFVAKEVSYLYGVNLEENGMLKNMSDFATKVMNEIEVTEADRMSEKTIDLCVSSPDLTGAYFSCDDEASRLKSDVQSSQNVQTFLVPQCSSDTSNLYHTPYHSDLNRVDGKEENSNESFKSVAEEYKYTDAEEGVVLLEKKLVVTPTISFEEEASDEGSSEGEAASSSSHSSSAPSSLSYNSDVLRCELNGLGYRPGPITKTTKKLYLRKLWRLRKEAAKTPEKMSCFSSPVLKETLTEIGLFNEIPTFRYLEEEMTRSFECWTKRKWREGTNKTSFNYLLLDPRVSVNLPRRAPEMSAYDAWKCFLSGIFYIGKGKRSRPYAHLYNATHFWEKRSDLPPDEKTERIVEIWKEGLGVVCLQVFQNIIPVEALTREAAMIEAMGVSSLKNVRSGEYYGVASTWPTGDKIRLGCFLLYKAMLIFLNEGERQIKPYDID